MNTPEEIVDVLVAGSGGGIAGAYTAAREGLSVALVEATNRFGGTFAYSGGGGMWYPCNPVLVRAGVDDTIDDALRYYRSVVGDRTPAELQETYVRGGAALIEYLERDEHFAFKILPWPDYYSSVPGARTDGMRHIVSKAVPDNRLGRFQGRWAVRWTTNVSVRRSPTCSPAAGRSSAGSSPPWPTIPPWRHHLNTSLVELVVGRRPRHRCGGGARGRPAHDSARVAVCCWRRAASNRTTRCGPNTVFREGRSTRWARPATRALAHRAAISAGASIDLMDQAWWSPGLIHPDGRAAFALCFTGGIFVDRAGRRFVNESAAYDRLGREIIRAMRDGARR